MLPTYSRLNAPPPVFRIPFRLITVVVVSFPLCSFVFCVAWSLVFDFVRSTYTHCDVPNFLPSISAAIGNGEMQKFVWRLAIIVHTPARLAVAQMYLEYYKTTIRLNRRTFVYLAWILNIVEVLALLALSIWTSSDDYEIHRNAFVMFIACSEAYMCICYFLIKNGRRQPLEPIEAKSLRYKGILLTINLMSFLLAGYCFLRHNEKCEPGVYTLFALFEYIVVFSNMGYHMTAAWDFLSCHVSFDWKNGLHLTQF